MNLELKSTIDYFISSWVGTSHKSNVDLTAFRTQIFREILSQHINFIYDLSVRDSNYLIVMQFFLLNASTSAAAVDITLSFLLSQLHRLQHTYSVGSNHESLRYVVHIALKKTNNVGVHIKIASFLHASVYCIFTLLPKPSPLTFRSIHRACATSVFDAAPLSEQRAHEAFILLRLAKFAVSAVGQLPSNEMYLVTRIKVRKT